MMNNSYSPNSCTTKTKGACILVLAGSRKGEGTSTIAANIAFSLEALGKSTTLLDTLDGDTSTPNGGIEPPGWARQVQPARGPWSAPQPFTVSSAFAHFLHLDNDLQLRVIAQLRELEERLDYLLVDSSGGTAEEQAALLLAAPQLLLVMTPEPASHESAFNLLKMLKRHYFEQPVYVMINSVADLAEAHDCFRSFRRATLKYLQTEVRYLGYLLEDSKMRQTAAPDQPIAPVNQKNILFQCLEAISARIIHLLHPGSELHPLSDHLRRLAAESGVEDRPSVTMLSGDQHAKAVTATVPNSPEKDTEGLRAGAHYAALLPRQD
ncbi:MAG: hypothetical protein KDI63_00705 [Gammaproteobacteria bacterium]|nr:hypothetical protein [Gammaproteobacteria bacterium]